MWQKCLPYKLTIAAKEFALACIIYITMTYNADSSIDYSTEE